MQKLTSTAAASNPATSNGDDTSRPSKRSAAAATFGVGTLAAMAVGATVGAGVFSLPGRFAQSTGVTGAVIAWAASGVGVLALALALSALAMRKPALNGGVYAYARAGFGEYAGFFSTLGYWAAYCSSNVVYLVLVMSTLGAWLPALGAGDTVLALGASSAAAWGCFFLVRRGLREAAVLNRIITVAKLLPLVVFVLLAVFAFRPEVFAANLSGPPGVPLFDQIRDAMFVTVFVYGGIECASVFSRHARRRRDVGRATLLGLLSVFGIFASVTIVSYGVLPVDEIAALREPSVAGVLEAVVGPWGAVFVGVGLIVTLSGAYLSCALVASEVMSEAARDHAMPRFLAGRNARDVPTAALATSTCATQVFLVVSFFASDVFGFALDASSALLLISWLLAAAYLVKIVIRGDGYGAWRVGASSDGRWRELLIGLVATLFTGFVLVAAGLHLVLLAFLVYVPATLLFVMSRREQGRRVFSGREWIVFAGSVLAAVAGVVALAFGWIMV